MVRGHGEPARLFQRGLELVLILAAGYQFARFAMLTTLAEAHSRYRVKSWRGLK